MTDYSRHRPKPVRLGGNLGAQNLLKPSMRAVSLLRNQFAPEQQRPYHAPAPIGL